jgi:tetratricopeptide (TPR) repeat protein
VNNLFGCVCRYRPTRRDYAVGVLLLVGLLLRIEYLREFSFSPLFDLALGADVSEYDQRAREIAAGVAAGSDIHAPLYSHFLGALYRFGGFSIPTVRAGQLLLNFLVWTAAYFVLRRRVADPGVPEIFLGWAMLYPAMIYFQAELVSEALVVPLLLGSLLLLDAAETAAGSARARRLQFGGGALLAGLAAVTHPMALFFLAAETIWFGWRKPRLRALWFAGIALLVILPVSVSRSRSTGRPVLIQENSAFNLFLGNNPAADGGCYLRPGAAWRAVHREAEERAAAQGISVDRWFLGETGSFVLTRPIQALGLLGRKALLVFSPVELAAGADGRVIGTFTPLMRYGGMLSTVLLFLSALAGLLLLAKNRAWVAYRHWLLLAGAAFACQVLTVGSGRYRLALLPALWLFSGYFLVRKTGGGPGSRLAAVAAGGVIIGGSLLVLPGQPTLKAEACSLYGEALYLKNQPRPAAAMLEQAIARGTVDPDRDYNLLGLLQQQAGDFEAAAAFYRRAAAAAPDSARGPMNLGVLAMAAGRPEPAETFFREALRRNGRDADALYNYGFFLERGGDDAGAETFYRAALAEAPAHRKSRNALGVVCFRRGDFQAAAAHFRVALRLEPDNAGLRGNLKLAEQAAAGRLPPRP